MAKFNFPLNKNQRFKFFVQAGPFISFLVGAKQLVKTADLKVYLDKAGQQQIPPEAVAAFLVQNSIRQSTPETNYTKPMSVFRVQLVFPMILDQANCL